MKAKRIFSILLIMSLLMNLVFGCTYFFPEVVTIYGTYSSDKEGLSDCQYIIFNQDGTCCRYKQFQIIEYGQYQIKYLENIIYIQSFFNVENSIEYNMFISNNSKKLYLIQDGKDFISFEKISSVPTYINVSSHETNLE